MQPLPSDTALEKEVIGYLITFWAEAEDVFLDLEIEYFSDIYYKKIIEKLYEMALTWKKIDIVSVLSELKDKDFFKKLWWVSFLTEITQNSVFLESIFTLTKKLRLLYQKREIIIEARKLENIGFNSEKLDDDVSNSFDDISKILNEWESKVTSMEDNIAILEKTIEENKSKDLIWYSWGENFNWLDKATLWIRKWKNYRIAWMSWAWKTSLIYEIIFNLLKQKAKVLFVTLENSIETTLTKFLSSVQEVNPTLIEKWQVKADTEFLRKVQNNLKITDQLFSLNEIKREILKTKPDVVILDYIWLVTIEWYTEETMYNKYADEIKQFIQKHKNLAFIDLSNLPKSETEDTIRMYWGFNWSAKLRNNCDFWMFVFPYKPFAKYKSDVLKNWTDKSKKEFFWKKALTFLISKSRLWDDGIEKQYLINFNKWIRFIEAKNEQINLWDSFC